MSRTVNTDMMIARHKMILEYQESIKPFVPTVRDLQKLWGVKSLAVVKHVLDYFVKENLVTVRECGSKLHYYAVR